MLTLFPRIRPNPIPPPPAPAEPLAQERPSLQNFESETAAAIEVEVPVAGASDVAAPDAPSTLPAAPDLPCGLLAALGETAPVELPVEIAAESGHAAAAERPAPVEQATDDNPANTPDARPEGLPFAAANIFDEIEILHETSVELRSAFVVEIPHVHVTLDEVVRATDDASREPVAEASRDEKPEDISAAQAVETEADGSAEEAAEEIEFSEQEVADIVAQEDEPLAIPFDDVDEAGIESATAEEAGSEAEGVAANEAEISARADGEPAARDASPTEGAEPPIGEPQIGPEATADCASMETASVSESEAPVSPSEAAYETSLAIAEAGTGLDTPAAQAVGAPSEEIDEPKIESAARGDVAADVAELAAPPEGTAEPAIETPAEPAAAATSTDSTTHPTTDSTTDSTTVRAESNTAAIPIPLHLTAIETESLPVPPRVKAKRPKGIGFFESVREPEEEAMDDSEEVEAYASAAAQSHLDAIDDTFVAHAQLLIKGRERGRALDIGTGPGQIVMKLGYRLTRWKLVGVDRSAAMIAKARESLATAPELAGRVELRVADGNSLEFSDGSFDLVICNSVLHHLAEPQKLFAEIARVVKPGGAILLRDLRRPTRFEFRGHVKKHGKHYDGEMKRLYVASVHAAYTEEELQKMLAVSLLRNVRVFRHGKTHIGFERAIVRT